MAEAALLFHKRTATDTRMILDTMENAKKTSFHLQEESTSFSSRSKDVFGSLDELEKKHDEKQKELDAEPDSRREQKQLWKADPVEESITGRTSHFKRPSSRPPSHSASKYRRRASQTPDYKLHPQKWTKYSLEDVESGDLSESSNTRAAFAFLEERRKLREATEEIGHPEEGDGKFVFKKPSKVPGGVNVLSSRKSKTSKAEKVKIKHLGAEEINEETDVVIAKKESDSDIPTREVEANTAVKEPSLTTFRKGSKKRSIRARNADVVEDS